MWQVQLNLNGDTMDEFDRFELCQGCSKITKLYVHALPHFPCTVGMCKSCWEHNVIPENEMRWLKHKIDTYNKTHDKPFIPSKKYYRKTIVFSREVIDGCLVTKGNFERTENITHLKKELIQDYGEF